MDSLRDSINFAPENGSKTEISFKNVVLLGKTSLFLLKWRFVYTKPLFFRVSKMNGGHKGFGGSGSQVTCQRTRIEGSKMRGNSPAAARGSGVITCHAGPPFHTRRGPG